MNYTVKAIKNINYDLLLDLVNIFGIKKVDINYYKNILEFFDNGKIIGFINFCITPSMKGCDKLFIRELFYNDHVDLDKIIKSLCYYCKNNKYSIMTTIDDDKFTDECKKIFLSNNFKGNDVIYFI